jgi:hypothetical protein
MQIVRSFRNVDLRFILIENDCGNDMDAFHSTFLIIVFVTRAEAMHKKEVTHKKRAA